MPSSDERGSLIPNADEVICPSCAWQFRAIPVNVQAELASLQAKIDALMLEYCPDEMTAEQKFNWAAHQVPANIAAPPQAEQAKGELCRQCGLPWITNTVHLHPLKQPAEARTERGERDGATAANLRRLILEHERSEGHAAGFADGEKLRDCLKYAIELLEEAHSGYISGTGPDMQWDKIRDETVTEAKELLQPKEGGR